MRSLKKKEVIQWDLLREFVTSSAPILRGHLEQNGSVMRNFGKEYSRIKSYYTQEIEFNWFRYFLSIKALCLMCLRGAPLLEYRQRIRVIQLSKQVFVVSPIGFV